MAREHDEPTAEALLAVAHAIHRLGLADAATPFGALEALMMETKDSSERIASALGEIADALRDMADAIREHKQG